MNNKLFFKINKEFTWPSLNNNVNCKQGFCYGLKTHIGILSDGTVVPCCLDAEGIIKLGNIFEENLESILKNERTQNMINNFRNNNRIEELCKHCDFKNLF